MQRHLHEHFNLSGRSGLLNDVSVKVIDKTDHKDPTKFVNLEDIYNIYNIYMYDMYVYIYIIYIYIYIYIYICIYIYIYNIYIYISSKFTRNVIVRLPHPRSGYSQGQETFLAASADKQTRNYDTECSNHHPSQSL